jgi:HEAT repeat protein/cyclophilin family peptidyl-prolyl cis-trans isomerase
MTKEKLHFHRLWIPVLICSLLPLCGCGGYQTRQEAKLNDTFEQILARMDSGSIGKDSFFEDNLLSNPNAEVRQWCALALGGLGSARALPLLYRAIRSEDASVRAASAFAVGEIEDRDLLRLQSRLPDGEACKRLLILLDDTSRSVQMRAIEALGKAGSHLEAVEIVRRLERLPLGVSPLDRAYAGFAITALARLKDAAAFPVLERLADTNDPGIQWRALDALARLQDKKAAGLFLRKLASPDPEVLCSAIRGLNKPESSTENHLQSFLPPRDIKTGQPIPLSVRCSAAQTLGRLKSTASIPAIRAALEADPIDAVHPEQQNFAVVATAALGEIGSADGEAALVSLLRSIPSVHKNAIIALAKVLRGTPERYFSLVEKNAPAAPVSSATWAQAMAELGGADAVKELETMFARTMENPSRPNPELIPVFLNSMVKAGSPRVQDILASLLQSRDPAILRAALSVYQPGAAAKEPWAPIVQAFENCAAGADAETKIEILRQLTPWVAEAKIQEIAREGLKNPQHSVRLVSLALLHKAGLAGDIEDAGPGPSAMTEATGRALAASRKVSTIAMVETSRGSFEIELFREDAPFAASAFVLQAKRGDYEGFIFSQVVPSQQLGGKITGSHSYSPILRRTANMRPFERGSVGIAAAGDYSSAGAFFIALSPLPYQDGIDTCFGRLISGIQVADRIVPGDRIFHVQIKETVGVLDRPRQ